jgi:hypothetical protein
MFNKILTNYKTKFEIIDEIVELNRLLEADGIPQGIHLYNGLLYLCIGFLFSLLAFYLKLLFCFYKSENLKQKKIGLMHLIFPFLFF